MATATFTLPRPTIKDLEGASQEHALRRPRPRERAALVYVGVLSLLRALGWHAAAATRRTVTRGGVTVRSVRPYILTVGALVCFTIAGFTRSPTLGFVVAGASALWLNHGLERDTGG